MNDPITPNPVRRPWWFIPGIAFVALTLSVFFFAPRLWLMTEYLPGTTQWDRAHIYLLQCEHPFRRDIEPAMLWRLLPPLVAHGLHLPGLIPLLLPWLGLVVTTCYVASLLRRRLDDTRFILGGTLLYAATSAVLVPVGWLGMNDPWIWLGLLTVAFGRVRWSVPLACLLCPWVDERFIIGFPLAWLIARIDQGEIIFSRQLLAGLWLLPYAVTRLVISWQDSSISAPTDMFLHNQLAASLTLLPLVPLAWWFGMRVAWGVVGFALWDLPRGRCVLTAVVLLGTLGTCVLLASDLSRSVAIALPLVLAGCFSLARLYPKSAPRILLLCGILNLLIPSAHMTYTKIDPINLLPVELYRLCR